MRTLGAILILLASGAAALAQDAPPAAPSSPPAAAANVDLGSPVVEALEVFAQPPGPALWKVTKGGAEVVVLGAVRPLPHSLAWDSARLDRALDGASVLLVQPKFTIGFMDMVRFKVGGTGARQDKPLEETLPMPLRLRFVGARTAAHQEAARYGRLKPYVAAFMLVGDYRDAAGLSDAKPDSTVLKLAKAHGVPVRPVAEYRVAAAIKAAGPMSEAASQACLQDAVDQVQWESDQSRTAAAAWAVGDLKGVRAVYPPSALERCLQQVPNVSVIERGTEDSTRAIAAVLAKPGKAVAIVDLNFLLRPNGVLDRLKAQGAVISVPRGLAAAMRIPCAALIVLACTTAASAQEPAADVGSPAVQALEVVVRPRGPALWRVTRGQSEVVVVGGVSPVPDAMAWDTGRVGRALDGARMLLVPPRPKFNVFDLLKLAAGMGKVRQGRDAPMEETLPEGLRDRFVRARIAAHRDAKRYARWKPFVAGFMLVGDQRSAAGLSNTKPGSTVEKLAAARHVPVRPVAEFRLAPMLKEAATISDQTSLQCLEDALAQAEAETAHALAASEAWAVGDLKGVRLNYSAPALERCLSQAPGISAVVDRGTSDAVGAILGALDKPGKVVAFVDMNFLLRPDGVLDRLKASGATITVPSS